MKRSKHPHLVVCIPPVGPDEILGFHAVEGHLPTVLRFPGEPFASLQQRALALATGRGRFAVTCIVAPTLQPSATTRKPC